MGVVHYSHSSLTYIGILFFWYDGQTGLPIGDRYWNFDPFGDQEEVEHRVQLVFFVFRSMARNLLVSFSLILTA